MEFCSECGTMMMPQEKGKHIWLVCPNCDHYRKLKEEDDYKIGEKKRNGSKVAVIEKDESEKKIKKPDYDIDTDACADLYENGY